MKERVRENCLLHWIRGGDEEMVKPGLNNTAVPTVACSKLQFEPGVDGDSYLDVGDSVLLNCCTFCDPL